MSERVTMLAAFKRSSPQARALAGLCVASLAWASAFIAGKVVLAEIQPLSAAAWRYAMASLLLLPFALRSRNPGRIREVLVPLSAMVLCGGVLYPSLFLFALTLTSATNTALMVALNPVLTLLVSPLVGEVLDRRRLLGVGLALAGAATVITHGDAAVLINLARLNPGDLLAIAAAVTWACFNIASKKVVSHLSPSLTNTFVYGIGGVILFLLASGEAPLEQIRVATPAALGGLAVMAFLSSALAGQLFLIGVRVLGVGRTVVFVYAVPVLTALLSSVFLGESLQMSQAVGGMAVIAGVYVTARTVPPTDRSFTSKEGGLPLGGVVMREKTSGHLAVARAVSE